MSNGRVVGLAYQHCARRCLAEQAGPTHKGIVIRDRFVNSTAAGPYRPGQRQRVVKWSNVMWECAIWMPDLPHYIVDSSGVTLCQSFGDALRQRVASYYLYMPNRIRRFADYRHLNLEPYREDHVYLNRSSRRIPGSHLDPGEDRLGSCWAWRNVLWSACRCGLRTRDVRTDADREGSAGEESVG